MKKSILVKFSLIPALLLIPTILWAASTEISGMPWWGWPTALFFTTFFMGVFGV
ncbi:MAG: sulfite exporter TauE/SafE family protein, partial [SAR324 cluster bacterium]